jgi:hypothetical protein
MDLMGDAGRVENLVDSQDSRNHRLSAAFGASRLTPIEAYFLGFRAEFWVLGCVLRGF